MTIAFPGSPSSGQIFQGWQWNGTAWVPAPASNVGPIGVRVFTANGTYAPTPGMQTCVVECVGGGASGNGYTGSSGYAAGGGGGGSGGYSRRLLTAAQIGASQPVTVGAGGPQSALGGLGQAGGNTSLGSLCVANGAPVGLGSINSGPGATTAGAVGDVVMPGSPGEAGMSITTATGIGAAGRGAAGPFGGGAPATYTSVGTNGQGTAATGAGAGGAGGQTTTTGTVYGGAGAAGLVIITEYAMGPAAAGIVQSGTRVLLSAQTVSTPVASVNFTGWDTSYDTYEMDCLDVTVSVEGTNIGCRLSANGGSSYAAGASDYVFMDISNCSVPASSVSQGGAVQYIPFSQVSYGPSIPSIKIAAFAQFPRLAANNGAQKWVLYKGTSQYSTGAWVRNGAGESAFTSAGSAINGCNAIQVLAMGSGNITGGTFKFYGIKN